MYNNAMVVPIGATHISEDNAAEHWLADDQVSNMGTGDVGMDGGRNEVRMKIKERCSLYDVTHM
jgi:hypothetical protein